MAETAAQNEQMEQLVKADRFGQIGLFQNIDDAADRIRDPAEREQEDRGRGHRKYRVKAEHNRPAHEQIQNGAQKPRCVNPKQFCADAEQRDAPDHGQKGIGLRGGQIAQNDRRVAARDQHVNHTVIELLEHAQDVFAAERIVIYRAGGIQRNQRQTEQQHGDSSLQTDAELDGSDQHDQQACARADCTDEMGIA